MELFQKNSETWLIYRFCHLPEELNKLTNLKELRLRGNNFTGKLPSFENFKTLQRLEIQASGFEGPIAPIISVSTQMIELRITDLTGGASEFPLLGNMTLLTRLVLRNCNLSGKIPPYITNMPKLKLLDLSLNKFEGQIPNLESLKKLDFLYLVGNRLTGPIPDWVKSRNSKHMIDLSYNNFSESSEPICQETLNLFRSYNGTKKSELGKCVPRCSKKWYSVHINCGGESVTIGDTVYEADRDSAGAAKFTYSKESWGASNSGYFWDKSITAKDYLANNISAIKGNDSELYTTARLSASSLTYYGRCLANGNYTVTLHFAEIVIRDNRSFQSLGKRIFEVYIQGERKLKDFDIRTDAGGVDKPFTIKFNATVADSTLEVRFQNAGKGTAALPRRGSYGPLVSAISFEANFKPPPDHKKLVPIIAGAVVSLLILIFIISFVAWKRHRNKIAKEEESRGLDSMTGVFTIRQIKAATNNFDAANKIGEGGFGSVYKVGALRKMSALLHDFSISFLLILVLCSLVQIIEAQSYSRLLPQQEKNALKEIAEQLGKKDWDFDLNPCDGNTNWTTPKIDKISMYVNNITCNCSTPEGFCHVQSILLKGQDLAGVLPPSLIKLPYLKTIDVSRNYLSGTIPPEWASIKLEYMSVMVNQLSGLIPKYLGNMTTLRYMSLENNMFNGTVPRELGNMVNLQSLTLSFNNLTGKLPEEVNKLTKLTELRLSGNNFTGILPSFESLKNLQKLEIQASGFEGPVPPSISVLTEMKELRVSDLTGSASEFPPLENMTGLTRLMLRSCNLSGNIPSYIANMRQLKILDLSFNRLEGQIPDLENQERLELLYLTSNSLTGPIQDWIKSRNSKYVIDLSYNNFNESSVPTTCRETLNLFKSYNSTKKSELGKCLSSNDCSKNWYSVHINCGGESVTIGDTTYEADEDSAGAAKFVYWKESWGSSNTGDFWDRPIALNEYKATNVSSIKGHNSELYTTARLSALSLTYYGRCLANGNYTVTLHFAEIVIRDNRSFQSLGKRMFDVYIQGERKLKDFDIRTAAGGVDEALTRKFNASVEDGILEVRFQYAGKGITAVPRKGTYGPLISAISFEANFKPPSNHKKMAHIIAGAVASSLLLLFTIFFVAWRRSRNSISKEEELRGLDLLTGVFTIRQIKAATNNFDAANKIGEGGFGSVYKGTLLDGTVIAVKQLSSKSKQGNREFVNEIGMISGLQHPNLVKLYGCCAEGNQLLLVYEYLENNSLALALFGPEEHRLQIDWPTRQKICIGIAKGLAFLHEESSLKIVHRDIKATNVLLDKKLNPKISDFGLAKLDDEDKTHISTRIAGTIGYMAPEYALWGYLTYKADVYSFGVVALEIVAGKNNMKYRPNEKFVCLLDWALVLQKHGKLMELVDETLTSDFKKDEALRMINVALLCTNPSPALRPTMSAVVSILEDHLDLPEFNLE